MCFQAFDASGCSADFFLYAVKEKSSLKAFAPNSLVLWVEQLSGKLLLHDSGALMGLSYVILYEFMCTVVVL